MSPAAALLLVISSAMLLGWLLYFGARHARQRRRSRLARAPLPAQRVSILERNVAQYSRLPEPLRAQLHALINVFLDEMRFVGCAGLEVSETMRVTIAGNACLLLLNHPRGHFEGFRSILVYPDTFVAPLEEIDGEVVTLSDEARAGESWQGGPVVLSWADIEDGLEHPGEGYNVVIHEFAHKLDEENDLADGLPSLREPADYERWSAVLGREFAALDERSMHGHAHLLDEYGAESPAEFFAVATEAFFECGQQLKNALPDLYRELRVLYGVDPAAWS